ncbi:hypothetical protein Tsubulata_027172 [Turnera subulata]|uniref:Uncharacterized protein n=1 Tax=Turnera subulata TaxID=218843 RepID=A0A9Q0GBA7_9ROSI|nr:hypothetical protein Tsubulata_027172 [Turnera subulata]
MGAVGEGYAVVRGIGRGRTSARSEDWERSSLSTWQTEYACTEAAVNMLLGKNMLAGTSEIEGERITTPRFLRLVHGRRTPNNISRTTTSDDDIDLLMMQSTADDFVDRGFDFLERHGIPTDSLSREMPMIFESNFPLRNNALKRERRKRRSHTFIFRKKVPLTFRAKLPLAYIQEVLQFALQTAAASSFVTMFLPLIARRVKGRRIASLFLSHHRRAPNHSGNKIPLYVLDWQGNFTHERAIDRGVVGNKDRLVKWLRYWETIVHNGKVHHSQRWNREMAAEIWEGATLDNCPPWRGYVLFYVDREGHSLSMGESDSDWEAFWASLHCVYCVSRRLKAVSPNLGESQEVFEQFKARIKFERAYPREGNYIYCPPPKPNDPPDPFFPDPSESWIHC